MILQSLPVYDIERVINLLNYKDICKLLRVSKYLANIVHLFIQNGKQNWLKDKMLSNFLKYDEVNRQIEVAYSPLDVKIEEDNCVIYCNFGKYGISLEKFEMGYWIKCSYMHQRSAIDIKVPVSKLKINGKMLMLNRKQNSNLTKIENFAMKKCGFAMEKYGFTMTESDKHLFVCPGDHSVVVCWNYGTSTGTGTGTMHCNVEEALNYLKKHDVRDVKLRVTPAIAVDSVFSLSCNYFHVLHGLFWR